MRKLLLVSAALTALGVACNIAFAQTLSSPPGAVVTQANGTPFLGTPNTDINSVDLGNTPGLAQVTTGKNNIAIGPNALQSLTSASSDVAVGLGAGALITTGGNNVLLGLSAGNKLTTGAGNVVIGQGVGSTTLGTGGGNVLIGPSSGTDAAAVGTNNSLNIANSVTGSTSLATTPQVCAIMMPCVLGVLKGANFNVTTDQTIVIGPMTSGDPRFLSTATKYWITEIDTTNCSVSLTTAQGGIYTAVSKGGTIIGATTTPYTNCTSTTTRQRGTALTNEDTTTLTAASLFLSLTTAQGAAATADVYVIGVPVN